MNLELDANVTWNGFLVELSKNIATPVDLVKLYKATDIERRFNYREYITDDDKNKKLIDIAGLEGDGEYEFDLELPCAAEPTPTKIKALNRCSIIGCGDKVFELDKPGSEYKIALECTGWVRVYTKQLHFTWK